MQLSGRITNPAFAVYHLFWGALDLLFPPTCGGCEKPGVRWCADCQRQVQRIIELCPICGLPQKSGHVCKDCRQNPPPYRSLRSFGLYQGTLREAIHRLKYQKDIGLGEALAAHLVDLLTEQGWPIDMVTAVPLSLQRRKQRGYNQAGMLARPLALFIDKPMFPGALERTRDTASQVGLTAAERRKNVEGAFRANPKIVTGKTVLVIDDVTTTGSTIRACAQALIDAGALEVYGLTLARAGGRDSSDDTDMQARAV